jgi:hypothetical protein
LTYSPREIFFILIGGGVLVSSSQGFIYFVFGSNWILPIYVGVLLVCQEILRGNYQIKAIKLVAQGGSRAMSRISGVLIFLSVSLIAILVYLFGAWGAPLAMLLVYLSVTLMVENELRKFSSAH